MKTQLILATAFLSILITGCAKDPAEDDNQSRNSLMSFRVYARMLGDAQSDGTVLIQSDMSLLNPNEPYNIDISEKEGTSKHLEFFEVNGKQIDIVGSTDQTLNTSLYGTTLKYRLNGQPMRSMYIPNLINPTYRSAEVKPNTTITWNADPRNANGVAIWITYKPTIQYFSIMEANRQYIVEGIVVPDTGTYTLTAQDLSRFPDEAVVDLGVARAASDISSDAPSVVAFTTKSLTAVLNKKL
ncbi:hypothetical protein HYN48_09195 [Flavobacterium magnum]|uniref:Lipoprotein n=1 Tax=Flavobacterium magnum TaxID=2162713 RepID=A0A2S0RHP2_9FLAO|nr:hypothetical protein [Flavobacterium magnum]AWA30242.1 hypothetical protein HYN48_09195 [Flavobacterium magnum]